MDSIKNKDSDFYPSMLLREFTLLIARIFILIIALLLYYYFKNNFTLLISILIIINWILYILSYISIKFHIKYENHYDLDNLH